MYDADPFAARKEVDERQAKAAKRREEASDGNGSNSRSQLVSGEFARVPEVRMASGLREMVEHSIKLASDVTVTLLISVNRARHRPAPFTPKQLTWFHQSLIQEIPRSFSKNWGYLGSSHLNLRVP
jgi:hypothetical protein